MRAGQPSVWLHPFGLLAALAAATMLAMPAARAQSAGSGAACPSLPSGAPLTWSQMDGPGFVFCKALRTSDGGEVFAVTLSRSSPFKPNRSDRAEEGTIAGKPVRWYRSEVATRPGVLIRETLVEVDDDRVAHVTVQALSSEQLAATMQLAEGIGFSGARLGSN